MERLAREEENQPKPAPSSPSSAVTASASWVAPPARFTNQLPHHRGHCRESRNGHPISSWRSSISLRRRSQAALMLRPRGSLSPTRQRSRPTGGDPRELQQWKILGRKTKSKEAHAFLHGLAQCIGSMVQRNARGSKRGAWFDLHRELTVYRCKCRQVSVNSKKPSPSLTICPSEAEL